MARGNGNGIRELRLLRNGHLVAVRAMGSGEGLRLEITLQHTGGAKFVAEARHHRLVVDQPAEDGATDNGMTPSELLLASLGGCVGQSVAQYLKLRGLPSHGLLIRVGAQTLARPLRLRDFEVEVVVPGLSERQLASLQKSLLAGLVQDALTQANSLRVTAVSMHSGDVKP